LDIRETADGRNDQRRWNSRKDKRDQEGRNPCRVNIRLRGLYGQRSAHRKNAATKRALSDQAHAESDDEIGRGKQLPAIEVAHRAGNDDRQRLEGDSQRRVLGTIQIER